ncbi:MAG: hypothetical protein KatS3mg107_1269 [Gemmataceae bacterium]|nr:MAG: hypothetical protein KatS3mg107_1269 [Gemmataceae bacterium]
MSRTGELFFGTTNEDVERFPNFLNIMNNLDIIGIAEIVSVYNVPTDGSYIDDDIEYIYKKYDIKIYDFINDLHNIVASKILIEIFSSNNKISEELFTTVRDQIPESIRGDFCPSQCILRFGPHKVPAYQIIFPGRELDYSASASVSFWGYGSPNDTETFYNKLHKLDIHEKIIQTLLRSGFMPLDEMLIFDV